MELSFIISRNGLGGMGSAKLQDEFKTFFKQNLTTPPPLASVSAKLEILSILPRQLFFKFDSHPELSKIT
jgi:hypothetical protein